MNSSPNGITLGELAVRFGCSLKGDPDLRVTHVATLEGADASAITFLANPKYRKFLPQTRAGAVILEPKLADASPVAALLSANPYATYARIAGILHPAVTAKPGVHPSAVVNPSVQVDPSASIGALAVIEAGVEIAARAVIGPGCVVMEGTRIGADTRLVASVTLCSGVSIGARCTLHPGVVIGADGFGLAPDRGEWIKVPQVGCVRIGNDVEIGANTTIDRGAIEDTVIGDGVKLDNQIQIGHNVQIGDHTVIAGCAGVSGSAVIGKRCMIGGMVGIAGHLTICDDVFLTGQSFVNSSIRKPGYYSSGMPVDETARFRKNAARFRHLDELGREVRRMRGHAAAAAPDPGEDSSQSE
ncbi:MAG: UDP-3-O-(3-hydroxymyristoyl)glucosamine N-acyltransferase [Povalibacter sp.]